MSELKQTIRYCKAPDGRAIAWSTMGSGPPVLVVSGVGHIEADLRTPPFSSYWSDLASRCTLIRYDGRGSGLSDREFQEITLDTLIDDALAVIDAARVERFSTFSASMGTPQAVELAARFPFRLERMVIYGGFARGLMRRGPTPEQIAMREALYAATEAGWSDLAFRTLTARQMYPTASGEEIEAAAHWYHASTNPRQLNAFLKCLAQLDVSQAATQIACPALVLHTRHNTRVPFDEGRRLASLIPNAEFVPVECRNSWAMSSEPIYPEVMGKILRFLATDPAAKQSPSTLPHLTPREHQVLELIAQGKDNLQIAAHLNLSEKTVRNHITPIFDKLQVENRAQAIVRAREAGMGKR